MAPCWVHSAWLHLYLAVGSYHTSFEAHASLGLLDAKPKRVANKGAWHEPAGSVQMGLSIHHRPQYEDPKQ